MVVFVETWFVFLFIGIILLALGSYITWSTSVFGSTTVSYLDIVFISGAVAFTSLSLLYFCKHYYELWKKENRRLNRDETLYEIIKARIKAKKEAKAMNKSENEPDYENNEDFSSLDLVNEDLTPPESPTDLDPFIHENYGIPLKEISSP